MRALKRFRMSLGVIGATFGILLASPASAAYLITYEQIGSNVVSTGNGSLLTGFTPSNTGGTFQGYVNPFFPELYVGSGVYSRYVFNSVFGPDAIGTEVTTFANSSTGNFVGFYYLGTQLNVLVASNYLSGADLGTSTATYNNRTLAGLGLNPGNYVYNFLSSTGADSITVQIGNAAPAVPEPATWAMMLLGFGAVGFVMRRRKIGSTRISLA